MRTCEILCLAVAVAAINCTAVAPCFGQTRAGAVRLTVNVPSDARADPLNVAGSRQACG